MAVYLHFAVEEKIHVSKRQADKAYAMLNMVDDYRIIDMAPWIGMCCGISDGLILSMTRASFLTSRLTTQCTSKTANNSSPLTVSARINDAPHYPESERHDV